MKTQNNNHNIQQLWAVCCKLSINRDFFLGVECIVSAQCWTLHVSSLDQMENSEGLNLWKSSQQSHVSENIPGGPWILSFYSYVEVLIFIKVFQTERKYPKKDKVHHFISQELVKQKSERTLLVNWKPICVLTCRDHRHVLAQHGPRGPGSVPGGGAGEGHAGPQRRILLQHHRHRQPDGRQRQRAYVPAPWVTILAPEGYVWWFPLTAEWKKRRMERGEWSR